MKPVHPPINIHTTGETIYLHPGDYSIYILGGFNVWLNRFQVELFDCRTDQSISCFLTNQHIQTYYLHHRAVKVFQFKIERIGFYELTFYNADSLRVEKSNMIIQSLFMKPIPNQNLQILITE